MQATFSTEDRALLRDSVFRFVQERYAFPARRASLASAQAYSRPVWLGMAELGLQGLLLKERDGGAGGGDEEIAIVMEEIGRGLLLEPYLSTAVICADLISSLGTPALRERLLPGLLSGDTIVALAHGEAAMGFARAPVSTRVETRGNKTYLTGAKSFVLDAPSAKLILVSAAEGDGLSLFAVSCDAPHLEMKPWRTADGRLAAELRLEGVPVQQSDRLGAAGAAADALDIALDRATLAVGEIGRASCRERV